MMRDTAETPFVPPISVDELPHVTPGIIIDRLASFDILRRNNRAKRVFRWFACPTLEPMDARAAATTASTLFVCGQQEAIALLESAPSAFAVVALDDAGAPDELDRFAERCVFVANASLDDVASTIQSLFIEMLVWEGGLERIALKGGSIADMLDAGARVLGNFMFVSDRGFNVIAATGSISPPDKYHEAIIERGCLTLDDLAEKRFRLPEGKFYTREAGNESNFARLSAPVHFDHVYCGSISMSCCERPLTQGLQDAFSTFIHHALPVCSRIWREQAQLGAPSTVFLVKLLEGQRLDDRYVAEQMKALDLAGSGQFKLIALEQGPDINPWSALAIANAFSSLNEGNAHVFPYRDHTLALCYSSESEPIISHRKTIEELERIICGPFGIDAGVSSIFSNIADIDAAYQQTRISLGFRSTILREQARGSRNGSRVFLFEDALLYYLVDPTNNNRRLLGLMFDQSIAQILYAEDQEKGTNTCALLWNYLISERNATETAKRLHVHRNSVLYHVEKIQARFDFDLDSRAAREWLLMAYKHLFLSLSEDSLESMRDDGEC